MTGAQAHDQEPIDDWLTARHRDLCDGLSQFLDPDAGLHETTTLHAEHANLLGALEGSLDTQAGLAAILRPSAEAATQPPTGTPDAAAAIIAADPAIRMALRDNPVILAVILSDLTVRALAAANEALTVGGAISDLYLNRALNPVLARARDLGIDLEHDLRRARNFAFGRGLAFDRELALALDLALPLELARELDFALNRNYTRDLARSRNLARDLGRALARDLGRALAFALALDSASEHAFALDLDHALARAREVADTTAIAVGHALCVQQAEGLAAALLEGALDDFTRADLTHVDLTGQHLTGMRWSDSGTRWPPGTDVDRLRTRSREIAPGTGVYMIASPGGDKALRHAPA